MKSIIARFTELKENVAGTEESEFDDLDFNNVDKALKSVGVQLKDSTGQFRDLDDVFLELSKKWDTLDRNSQRYIATIAAGSRQQSRFIAMMENYDRTVELVSTAYDSAGRGEEQFAKSQDTLQAKLNTLTNTWEQFRIKFFDQTFFKNIIDLANELLDKISNFDMKQVLALGAVGITLGKTVITNFIQQLKEGTPKITQAWNQVMNTSLKERFSAEGRQQRKEQITHMVGGVTQTDKDQFTIQQAGLTLGPKNAGFPTMSLDLEVQKTRELQRQLNLYQNIKNNIEQTKQQIQQINPLEYDKLQTLQKQLSQQEQAEQNQLKTLNDLRSELGYEKEITAENAKQIQQGLANNQNAPKSTGFWKSEMGTSLKTAGTSALTAGLTTAVMSAIAGGDLSDVLATAGASAFAAAVPSILSAIMPVALSFLAGPAGIIVIIIGIVAVIGKLLDTINKKEQAAKEAELERLRKTEELNKEMAREQEKILADYRSKVDENKTLDENLKKYNYLNNKAVLTTEEETEMATLAKDLSETYPEIISSYDENTSEIQFNTHALEELKETLQKEQDYAAAQLNLNSMAQSQNLTQGIDRTAGAMSTLNNIMHSSMDSINSASDITRAETDNLSTAEGQTALVNAIKSINLDYAKEAGISEDLYNKAVNGDILDFIQAIEDANISLNTFGNMVLKAGKLQSESYEEQLKETNAQSIKNNLITAGIDEDIADMMSNVDLGNNIQNIMKDKTEKYMNSYFKDINNDTFGGGHIDAKKDFLDDIRQGNFERLKADGTSTNDFLNAFANYGYTKEATESTKGLAELFEGDSTNLVEYDKLTDELKQVVDTFTSEEDWNENRDEAEFASNMMKKLLTFNFIAEDGLLPEGLTAEEIQKYEPQLNKIQEAIGNSMGKTIEEYGNSIDNELKKIENNEQIKNAATQKKEEALATWEQDLTDIFNLGTGESKENYSEVVNDTGNDIIKNFVSNLSQASATTLNGILKDLDATDFQKEQLVNTLAKQFSNYGSEISDILLSVDVSKSYGELMNSENEYINMITKVTKNRDKATEIYENYIKTTTSTLARAVIGDVGIEGVKSSLNAQFSGFDEQFEKIFSAQEEFYEDGKISSKTYFEMIEAGFEDFVDITENGYVLLADKAEEYYVATAMRGKEQVQQTIDNNKQILADIQQTYNSAGDRQDSINTAISATKSGTDYDTSGYTEKEKNLIETIANSAYDTYEEYVQGIIDTNVKLENMQPDAYIQGLVALEEHYKNLGETVKEQEEELQELQDELADLEGELADLQDELADLNNELVENQEAIDDAYKAWQESIHGTEDYQSSIDGLINYNNLLEETERNLNEIKEGIEDIQSVDEGSNTIQQLKNSTEQQLGQLGAEKQVIENAMENVYQTLTTNYGNYTQFDENGKLAFDFSIEDADMPDTMKDTYQTLVEQYNDFVSQKEDISDKEEDANQAFLDIQKEFLDSRVSMEEKVIDLLKEQMQKEVDQVNEKYEAIEEADNNYLDALEEAINKQRELREQENKYEDLAQKQKKLSLMQRDTSGANQKEVQQLQEEIQNDRQDLLNDEIDNVIDSLKELYEKQAEARELEIEAMEVTIEDMTLLNQMAQDVIAGFQNSDDIVSWFVGNNPAVQDMTVAQTEQYINEVKEESSGFLMSIATQTDDVTLDAERVAEITQATFEEVAQGITDVGTVTQEQAERTAQEAIDDAKEAYDSAVQAMNDTQAKIEETKNKITETNNEIIKTHDDILLKEQEVQKARNEQADAYSNTMNEMVKASKSAMEEVAQHATQFMIDFVAKEGELSTADDVYNFADKYNLLDNKYQISQGAYNAFKEGGYNTEKLSIRQDYEYIVTFSPPSSGISIERGPFSSVDVANAEIERLKKLNNGGTGSIINNPIPIQYKTGGLVNYTGPAWVDGTPSKPEAFLSSEDTLRIGEAAKLLASLPALQSTSSTSNISNTKIGDTSIEIHLNIAELSNDYDVDQMVERIKKDIVDVSNSIGSSVILKK